MKLPPIKHAVFINAPRNKVFETLTTAKGWDEWFTSGMLLDLDKRKICFVWKDFGAEKATLTDGGIILEIENNSKFVFQWHPIESGTIVSFTLTEKGNGTMVQVEEIGYVKPSEISAMISVSTGWGEALTLLKFYLEHGVTYGEVP